MHFDCYIGKVDVVSSRYSALLGKNEIIPEVRAALLLLSSLLPQSYKRHRHTHFSLPFQCCIDCVPFGGSCSTA